MVTNTCALFAVRVILATTGARLVNSFLIPGHLLDNSPTDKKLAMAVLRFAAEGEA